MKRLGKTFTSLTHASAVNMANKWATDNNATVVNITTSNDMGQPVATLIYEMEDQQFAAVEAKEKSEKETNIKGCLGCSAFLFVGWVVYLIISGLSHT